VHARDAPAKTTVLPEQLQGAARNSNPAGAAPRAPETGATKAPQSGAAPVRDAPPGWRHSLHCRFRPVNGLVLAVKVCALGDAERARPDPRTRSADHVLRGG
jgi:hypothetical protein